MKPVAAGIVAVEQANEIPTLTIEPTSGWLSLGLGEIRDYRELLYFLVWRDVKVRYKQTLLGAAWAILQPTLTMIVFSLLFGKLASIGSDGLPYPIFAYAGLLPWTFFAQGLSHSSESLVGSANLIRKVYFPRLVIPAAAVLAGVVDFLFAFVVLIGLMAYYHVWPGAPVLFLPVLLALAFSTSLGIGMWLSALNVEYRDIRYVVPFFVQLWLFVTPVIYPASRVAAMLAKYGIPSWVYGLNPMAGVVEGFRWALLGKGPGPWSTIGMSAVVSALMLLSGAYYFRRMEKSFADVV